VSAKAKAVIAANMTRFYETQSVMPWHGRTSHAELDPDWDAVERWDCVLDRWDGITEMTRTVPFGTATAKGK
jgi:hypothetical protein